MLATDFLNIKFSNPFVLPSGIMSVKAVSLCAAVKNGYGGVTTKSISTSARAGHPPPIMWNSPHYHINAVGLTNPGIQESIKELKAFKSLCQAPLIASIFAGTPEEFAQVAEGINQAPIDFLEINISCPNVSQEFGEPFAYSPAAVETITRKVKEKSKAPILVKLSPNAWNITEIAKAAEGAGADGITAVNTMSGMAIDIKTRKPVLSNKRGGVSGPALFPIALRCVYDIYEAVKIPIIGTGGITSGQDALAMVMAGATLLGAGSALYCRGNEAIKKIIKEMEQIMQEQGIKSLEEIRGVAH